MTKTWQRESAKRSLTIVHPDGTEQPRRRRLLSGRTVDAAVPALTWVDLVAPGPKPTGGARANPNHPSRKHD